MRKIIGIGETVFDIIFKNSQPVRATPGGSTFNSIISVGRMGIPAEFISETGDDRVGGIITAFLEKNGVSSKSVFIHKGQKSALSLAFLNAQNDAEYTFYKDHDKDRLEFVFPQIHADDVVIFGSFYAINPVVRRQVRDFLEYAANHGAILYYDVNFRASHRDDIPRVLPNILENLDLCDIVRGSGEDFEILFGCTDADEIYRTRIKPHVGNLVYTRGGDPAELRSLNGVKRTYPVRPVQTVSTIGAGDSFNAGFVCGLVKKGITREQIRSGLTDEQWDVLFDIAQSFAANVCGHYENYITPEFAVEMTSFIPNNA